MAHRPTRPHRLTTAGAFALLIAAAGAPALAQAAADPKASTEQHIATLKSELHITAAEEAPWNAFADVMRQNAAEISDRLAARQQGFSKMNAVDDLKSYADISSLHAQENAKLVAPFETLYGALSPAQKEAADRLFQNTGARHAIRG